MANARETTRPKGGQKNEKTGIDWTRAELEKVCDLYIELKGEKIHETNPRIHDLAKELGRTVRSVENQLLGFRKVATKATGRQNYNRLIPVIWRARTEVVEQRKSDFHFRISSALKDIIGRDLITDEYIAIFELVKNSYDAYATRVDIYFEDIGTTTERIIIKDNGKGMDRDDLINKWLFVAYSAKREGKEDENFDYRDNIYSNRAFAGAKGIGRFSCDRLGAKLILETTKKGNKTQTHVLITDWGQFEEDSGKEFFEIGVEHKVKSKSSYGLEHGTVLEISELRNEWDREKLLKLKKSLAKLINPNRGKDEKSFRIFLHASKRFDLAEEEKVNGEVKNFIFETLGLKTTRISASISADSKFIITELIEGGTLIYRITERNPYNLLDNIECTLYYLNRAAKYSFSQTMGVSSKDYGHIFLYKNGFRIYPYGEPGADPLQIDARKQQGTRRYLGTRELIGQIEIFSDTDQIKETSSRGDGLIKTDTYYQLEDFFWENLKRLEKYVVDVQKWGLSIEDDNDLAVHERATKLIGRLADSEDIVKFEYATDFLSILEANQSESAIRVIKNLKQIAIASNDNELLKEVSKAEKQINELKAAQEEAALEAQLAKKELREIGTENLFLKSIKSQDLDEIVSFMHSIGISASTIDNYLSSVYQKINRNMAIEQKRLKEIIEIVSFENRKIISVTRFATKANFKLFAEETSVNLVEFISEYLINIVEPLRQGDIFISVLDSTKRKFLKTVKPIEISILIDNFISNSIRARAKHFVVQFLSKNDILHLIISDDGKGIREEHLDRIFDFGFTTTSGSGLGLFHVKQILSNIGADIRVNNKVSQGVQFEIIFNRS